MSWSYRVARVAGIEVKIHATFLLILLVYGWLYYAAGGWPAAVAGVAFVLVLFLCVLLHEFGHAFAARGFGIQTPDITLLPIGGVARLQRMPSNPWQELVIAVAGPAVNVAIALALVPFVAFRPSDFETLDSASGGFAEKLLAVNLMLVAFNMIPAFPMDGGRVLRALLATRLPHVRATVIATRVGQVCAGLLGLWGFLGGNPILLFIAFFVFAGAQQELQYAKFMEMGRSRRVGELMTTRFATIPNTARTHEVKDLAARQGQLVFPVVDGSLRLVGMVRREDILRAEDGKIPVYQAAAVSSADPVARAIGLMNASGQPILPVVNPSGQIVGLVSRATFRDES